MSTTSKVSSQDIRRIIFENFNDTDLRFSNDDILAYLNKAEKYKGLQLDVLDFEDLLLDMETSGMLRPIAQNFNTRYYRLWDYVKQGTCTACGKETYFVPSEEKKICPHCSAII